MFAQGCSYRVTKHFLLGASGPPASPSSFSRPGCTPAVSPTTCSASARLKLAAQASGSSDSSRSAGLPTRYIQKVKLVQIHQVSSFFQLDHLIGPLIPCLGSPTQKILTVYILYLTQLQTRDIGIGGLLQLSLSLHIEYRKI